jgi:hypothetical protein
MKNVSTAQYVGHNSGGPLCSISFNRFRSSTAPFDDRLDLFFFFERCLLGTRSMGLLTLPRAPYSPSFFASTLRELFVSASPS